MHTERRYWPFAVLPEAERTDFDHQMIRFLEIARLEGFQPYNFYGSDFGAGRPNERTVQIFHRGANRRWELLLAGPLERLTSFVVTGFDNAGDAALRWLRGDDAQSILRQPYPGLSHVRTEQNP